MIAQGFAAALNHLLGEQPWARERLRTHAGRTVEFRVPPWPAVRFAIAESGLAKPASEKAEIDLVVTLKPAALPVLLSRGRDAVKDLDFRGPEDLAASVQELLMKLQWDIEEDLARVLGDVAAHRIALAARDFAAWQREALERLGQNFVEYWTEEQVLLARRAEFESFARELDELRRAAAQFQERVESAARALSAKKPPA